VKLIDKLRGTEAQRYSVDDYAAWVNSFQFGGSTYGLSSVSVVQQTLNGSPVEKIPHDLVGYASAYRSNGIVFACEQVRLQVFSAIRFQFQRFNAGRPGGLFSDPSLDILETPYLGGTTQSMLRKYLLDADFAGNGYLVRDEGELIRLRPDWVSIMLERNTRTGTWLKKAYLYDEDGPGTQKEPRVFWPENVAHFAPHTDPLATFRGMSWLTPIVRETQTDNQMNNHKQKFFENAATPNLAVKLDPAITVENFEKFKMLMEMEHRGADNAYKTMFLGGGADVTVIGKDFKQIDLKSIQGHGETRVAAAAGVPPIIVGLTEGLEAATYANYGLARRRFADGTVHPLWQDAAGTLANIVPAPTGTRLWYDSRDVPFLREDEKAAAEIEFIRAQTIRQYIEAGFTADSAKSAVDGGDATLLQHTGLVSVQLQEPGATQPTPQEAT
jgi:phage portal protein BeeE